MADPNDGKQAQEERDDAAAFDAEQARVWRQKLDGGNEPTVDELRTLIDLSTDLIAVTSFDGHFHLLNSAWETALGVSRAELRSRPYMEFVHPDDRNKTATVEERLMPGGQLLSFQNRYRAADGSYRHMNWRALVSNEKRLFYSATRDATEQIKAVETRAVLDAVLELSRDAILVQDADGNVSRVAGAAWQQQLGYAPGQPASQPVNGLLALDAAGKQPVDLAALEAMATERVAVFVRTANGPWLAAEAAVVGLGSQASPASQWLATLYLAGAA
jgi:PAS domain S-box-containing protein